MVDNVNGLNALPIGATANNIPAHIQLLKDDLNGGSIIRRLTGAAIAALSAPEKVAGVVVYNTTTGTLQVYNGSAFVNIDAAAIAAAAAAQSTANAALPKSGGTMSGDIAMGSNKITGLGTGTASTDAVNKSQLDAVNNTAGAALPKAGGLMTGTLQLDQSVKLQGPYPAVGDLTIHTPTGQVVLQGPAGTPASGQIAHANATYANQSATLGQIPSSRDVKQNITDLSPQQRAAFDKVAPVAFEYREGCGPNEVEQQGVHLGFIAEDVRDAGIRIVEDPDGAVVGLQPFELIAVLWAKVQDLQAQVTTLKEGS